MAILVSQYAAEWTLLPWISLDRLNWTNLSKNPKAIHLILKNLDKVDWRKLSKNPNDGAVELLNRNPSKIVSDKYIYNTKIRPDAVEKLNLRDKVTPEHFLWRTLSKNIGAIPILEQYFDKIDWYELSANPAPGAMSLLKRYPSRINWKMLSLNPNPDATTMLEQNQDKIHWWSLSQNPGAGAIELLKQNRDKINLWCLSKNIGAIDLIRTEIDQYVYNYNQFCRNNFIDWFDLSKNTGVISLLEQNQDKIYWIRVSSNPSCIALLKRNQHEINWGRLSKNPSIFEPMF